MSYTITDFQGSQHTFVPYTGTATCATCEEDTAKWKVSGGEYPGFPGQLLPDELACDECAQDIAGQLLYPPLVG